MIKKTEAIPYFAFLSGLGLNYVWLYPTTWPIMSMFIGLGGLVHRLAGLESEARQPAALTHSAGFAGCLYTYFLRTVSPTKFGFDDSVLFLEIVLIGGAAAIRGAIFGAAGPPISASSTPISK